MNDEELVEVMAEEWPEGVTDGLSSPCYYCERIPVIDYGVRDDAWDSVFERGHPARHGVVCIDCFAGLLDVPLASVLVQLQVAHGGQTAVMTTETIYRYEEKD